MSDQSTAASETPKQTVLCKTGCGFFGSNATGDYCSKCWNQMKAKQGEGIVTEKPVQTAQEPKPALSVQESLNEDTPTPMEVDEPTILAQSPIPKQAPVAPKKKSKKKKKMSYKDMMSSMLQGSGESRDIEKEKEALRKVTGGGAFSKIDKI